MSTGRAGRRVNACDDIDEDFRRTKRTTAAFYAEPLLPQAAAMLTTIKFGDSCHGAAEDDL